MIDIVIIACLIGDPDVCKPYIVSSPGSIESCTRSSIMTVARWAGEHPDWQIKRFECRLYDENV